MVRALKEKEWQEVFLKLMIIVGLFCPIYMSRQGYAYYPWFVFANVFVVLFLASSLIRRNFCKRNTILIYIILFGILLYNVFGTYINHKYLGLYGTQINISIAILFFCGLVSQKDYSFMKNGKLIDFLMKAIVLSNILGIVIYFLGYNGISFRGIPELIPVDGTYYERRFNWIYSHKSQYALMLVLFIALFVVYRKRFRNKAVYFGSIAVLMIGLVISHTYTSLCAAMFIFAGQFFDYIREKGTKIKKTYGLFLIPFAAAGTFLVYQMAKERNIWTLGGRVPIWKESVNILQDYPNGIGSALGMISFEIPDLSFEVYNCHNYFLNQMLCFSIPSGLCFITIFIFVVILTLRQKVSFLSVGIWIALLIPLNMDYALTPVELAIFLFIIFCIFWKRDIVAEQQE